MNDMGFRHVEKPYKTCRKQRILRSPKCPNLHGKQHRVWDLKRDFSKSQNFRISNVLNSKNTFSKFQLSKIPIFQNALKQQFWSRNGSPWLRSGPNPARMNFTDTRRRFKPLPEPRGPTFEPKSRLNSRSTAPAAAMLFFKKRFQTQKIETS